jgi:hypothetical protein
MGVPLREPSEAAIVNSAMSSIRQPASERTSWLRLVRADSTEQEQSADPYRQLQQHLQRALHDKRIAAADALDAYAAFLEREFHSTYANTVLSRASTRSRRTALRLRDRDRVLDREDRAALELVIDRIDSRLNARWPEADPVLSSWAAAIGSALRHMEAMALMDLAGADRGVTSRA